MHILRGWGLTVETEGPVLGGVLPPELRPLLPPELQSFHSELLQFPFLTPLPLSSLSCSFLPSPLLWCLEKKTSIITPVVLDRSLATGKRW